MKSKKKTERKNRGGSCGCSALFGGFVRVPVRRDKTFGRWLDLTDKIPADANCIMVMVNSGVGLNAGYPKPVGFLRLSHQLYLRDIEELLKAQSENDAQSFSNGTLWVTVAPIRSGEYVDVWSKNAPNDKLTSGTGETAA